MSRTEILPTGATLRGYDRWARQYDDDANPMVAATAWRLALHPLAVDGARVVELGCGTGRHAPLMLAAGARAYVGVDGSSGMLARAQARTPDPRCAWVLADLAAVPPLGEPCDAGLIVLVLEHVADLAGPFGAMAAVLRPGGTLRIVEIHPDLVASGTVAHFRDEGGGEVRFTSVSHPVAEMVRALAAAGFTDVRAEEPSADGELLAAAPRLAKHAGRRVLVDISARRS